MRGRKPKPPSLKLVTGNPGKRRMKKGGVKAKRVIPSPPEHLTDGAKLAWGALSTRLDRLGLLTELDAFALEQLCENYAEILALRKDVATNGRVQIVTTTTGDSKESSRPAVTQLSDAEKRFRMMMSEFGLTPSSRTRIDPADDGDKEKEDPAASYFG